MSIYPKQYQTLLLSEGQDFNIKQVDYQIVKQIRVSNGVDQDIIYIFKRVPDRDGWRSPPMSHNRVDELELTNEIKYR